MSFIVVMVTRLYEFVKCHRHEHQKERIVLSVNVIPYLKVSAKRVH